MHGPYIIADEDAFICLSPRTSRRTGIREMPDAIRGIALQNHAALLAALDAYEAGLITKEAYQELRVGATFKHNKLRDIARLAVMKASDPGC